MIKQNRQECSRRLQTAARMLPEGGRVADIGTDHAYLPIYLIRHHLASHVIAMDVRKGPLEKAAANIRQQGMEKQIELRLSDGLMRLQPQEVQAVSICGMGGPLMQRILTEGQSRLSPDMTLVLSPQSELEEFRSFLAKNGYVITEEKMLQEEGHFYTLIACHTGGQPYTGNRLYFRYGKLLQEQNAVLYAYLRREKQLTLRVWKNLQDQPGLTAKKRREELEQLLALIAEAEACYDRPEKGGKGR